MRSDNKRFPFEYMRILDNGDGERKVPFVATVENVLNEDIQAPNTFGCKVLNCHTHAGSKVHFDSFIEAELLFHNSFYNCGFAVMTCEHIKETVENHKKNKNDIKNIALVGYENYSELYLREVKRLVEQVCGLNCDYMIYETVVEKVNKKRESKARIRNYKKVNDAENEFSIVHGYPSIKLEEWEISETLFVLIVPINTTLTTMDKMYAKLLNLLQIGERRAHTDEADVCISDIDDSTTDNATLPIERSAQKLKSQERVMSADEFSKRCEFITLITLGDEENEVNDYWVKKGSVLRIKEGSGLNALLSSRVKEVVNFAYVEHRWTRRERCKACFPIQETGDGDIKDEKPIFDTVKGSVVPMVKFGAHKYIEPFNEEQCAAQANNFKKVWELTKYMLHQHIIRSGNHFQFYFDTAAFFENNKARIEKELVDLRDKLNRESEDIQSCGTTVYDYIITPRHITNAGFVCAVNDKMFDRQARIVYFDADKEYRSNLLAKYSDLRNSLVNIVKSGERCLVRFHYVDDVIQSGATYSRVKSLMESLVREAGSLSGDGVGNTSISLFDRIFLLVNRVSCDTLRYYLGSDEESRVYRYVDLYISPMRNHDDACTLCRLTYEYENIIDQCGLNELADQCAKKICDHEPLEIYVYLNRKNNIIKPSVEQRAEVCISHLLDVRLRNEWHIGEIKADRPLNEEAIDAADVIMMRLTDYYNNYKLIAKAFVSSDNPSDFGLTETSYKIAFIKAISRPFFIYYIRRRQAAFSFCLNLLDDLLAKNFVSRDEVLICKELVKALVNMRANYLIRKVGGKDDKSVIEKILSVARTHGDYTRKEFLFHLKSLISLADSQKSKLLETWLVKGEENDFYKYGNDAEKVVVNKPYFIKKDDEEFLKSLYLENNVILYSGFLNENQDIDSYFMSDFKYIFATNGCDVNKKVLDNYRSIREILTKKDENCAKDNLDEALCNLWYSVVGENEDKSDDAIIKDEKTDIISFMFNADPNENKLFKFAMLNMRNDQSTLQRKRKFYHDDHIDGIFSEKFERNRNSDIYFYTDHTIIYDKNDERKSKNTSCVVVKFRKPNNMSAEYGDSNMDSCIYAEIRNFDEKNIKHWFALKIIMTLRRFFEEYIKNHNITHLTGECINAMRKDALAINKAATHSEKETIFAQRLDADSENILLKEYIETINDETKSEILYHKYWQLVSNEYISSLFRKIVRFQKNKDDEIYNDNNCYDSYTVTPPSGGDIAGKIRAFWKIEKDEFTIPISRSGKPWLLKVKMTGFEKLYNMKDECLLWAMTPSIPTIIYLIYLMAMNVVKHADGNEMDLTFTLSENEELRVSFSNDLKSQIGNELYNYIHVPPWLYNDSHITLWTFQHAVNAKNPTKKITMNIDNKDKKFTIVFNIPKI